MALVGMIPAHNEAGGIQSAVRSLSEQATAFDRVIVVADNCSDATADLARACGAEVLETVGNVNRKAGALMQGITRMNLQDEDYLLVLDADTRLGPDYMRVATECFDADPDGRLGAVGGIFHGDRPRGVLERLQTAEYARYAREIGRRQGRVHVLTGTASVYRVRALRDVAAARGSSLPGRMGDAFDTGAITEDNEITLALKTSGWRLVSPRECLVYTELMPTAAALHNQRLRWYRGALDDLRSYGFTPVTRRYWLQQAGLLLSSIMLMLYLMLMTLTIATGHFTLSWFWTGIGLVFIAERVVTVWRAGWQARLTAMALLPELIYDLFLQVAFFRAVSQLLRGVKSEWKHHQPVQPREV